VYSLNLIFFAPWQRSPFWIFSTPQKLPHTTVDILTKIHEVWWKESQTNLNPPFFVSMETAANFVFLSFFRQKFIWHISRRLLNGNQWNFTGMLSTMSRCADYFRNFQNGHRCHGNGQNAKKLNFIWGLNYSNLKFVMTLISITCRNTA
jgi:hypothetical protein